MNKKITIFSLALLALVSGFVSANAAEPKKKELELSAEEKTVIVATETVQDVYDNVGSLALKMTIASTIMHSLFNNYVGSPKNLFWQTTGTGLHFFDSCSNALWVLTVAKYCSSASMDYGLKALLLAVGQYAVGTGLQNLPSNALQLPVVGQMITRLISSKLDSLGRLALIAAVAKCAICIGRKGHEYINSKLDAVEKQDIEQEAGLVVAA